MCLSPQSQRSNVTSFFKDNNAFRNKSKDDTNKIAGRKLTSRNSEIVKNYQRENYRKIIPKNLINFSSNNSNSTSSNNSNLNIARTYKNIFREYDIGSKDSVFIKKNVKQLKKKDILNCTNMLNYKNEKYRNLFKKYKTKINNISNNSKNNITNVQNRTMHKNNSKDLIISKVIDKLAISNLNKINNINLSSNSEIYKYDIENTLLGSMTAKNYNSFKSTGNNNIINFKPSNCSGKYNSKTSSAKNIHSKTSSSKVKSNKNSHRPNSNDNLKKNKNKNSQKNKKGKKVNLSRSKDNSSLSLNKGFPPQKKIGNDVRLNNNKIEYVQINLFNNKNDDKSAKENLQSFNENDNNKNAHNKKNKYGNNNKNTNKKNLVINENGGIQDNIVITKSFLCYNINKNSKEKKVSTPEENHFQAIHYLQLIKKNSIVYS